MADAEEASVLEHTNNEDSENAPKPVKLSEEPIVERRNPPETIGQHSDTGDELSSALEEKGTSTTVHV